MSQAPEAQPETAPDPASGQPDAAAKFNESEQPMEQSDSTTDSNQQQRHPKATLNEDRRDEAVPSDTGPVARSDDFNVRDDEQDVHKNLAESAQNRAGSGDEMPASDVEISSGGSDEQVSQKPDTESSFNEEIASRTDIKTNREASTVDQDMREAPQAPRSLQKGGQDEKITKEHADVENMQAIERDRSESSAANDKVQPSIDGESAESRKEKTVNSQPDASVSVERLRDKLSPKSQQVLNQLIPNGHERSLGEDFVMLAEKANTENNYA